jgi:hypothetical protein
MWRGRNLWDRMFRRKPRVTGSGLPIQTHAGERQPGPAE